MPNWRDLAELVRAPAALSVPGDTIAGAVSAGTLGRTTPGLIASSVCLYWAGMAANDWADRELDAVERPTRPLPSGRVSPQQALNVAVGLTAAGIGFAALSGGRRAAAVALPLAAAVWAYDLRAKNTRGGPAMMATCRGLDVLLGASGGRWTRALPAALTIAAHTYTVTALSRREVSGADPLLPVVTLASTVGIAAAAASEILEGNGRPGNHNRPRSKNPAGVLAGLYAVRYGGAQAQAIVEPSAKRIRAAVTSGITGLPLLQGALTARAGAGLAGSAAGLAVAALAPLARRLAKAVSPT